MILRIDIFAHPYLAFDCCSALFGSPITLVSIRTRLLLFPFHPLIPLIRLFLQKTICIHFDCWSKVSGHACELPTTSSTLYPFPATLRCKRTKALKGTCYGLCVTNTHAHNLPWSSSSFSRLPHHNPFISPPDRLFFLISLLFSLMFSCVYLRTRHTNCSPSCPNVRLPLDSVDLVYASSLQLFFFFAFFLVFFFCLVF